ncbi:hypothetical protein Hanom_Chr15g01343671 [Helianthus anomalus]
MSLIINIEDEPSYCTNSKMLHQKHTTIYLIFLINFLTVALHIRDEIFFTRYRYRTSIVPYHTNQTPTIKILAFVFNDTDTSIFWFRYFQ